MNCPDCGTGRFVADHNWAACFECGVIYAAPARTKAERPVEDDMQIHPDFLDIDVAAAWPDLNGGAA